MKKVYTNVFDFNVTTMQSDGEEFRIGRISEELAERVDRFKDRVEQVQQKATTDAILMVMKDPSVNVYKQLPKMIGKVIPVSKGQCRMPSTVPGAFQTLMTCLPTILQESTLKREFLPPLNLYHGRNRQVFSRVN